MRVCQSSYIGMHVSLCLPLDLPSASVLHLLPLHPLHPLDPLPRMEQGSGTTEGAAFNHRSPLVVIPLDNGC